MGEYSYIITNTGLAKITAALTGGDAVNVTQIAVGDGYGAYYEPVSTQTTLVHETKRVSVNSRGVDTDDTTKLYFLGTIPAADYGYEIRECGLFDSVGDLIAIRKYPLIDKTNENNMIELYLKEELIVSNTSAFSLTVDPTIIMATQQYVENELSEHNADLSAHYDVTQTQRGFMSAADKIKLDELNFVKFADYAVNSGYVDSSGHADLITKVSDTEISFKVGAAYPNAVWTYPNGKTYEISEIPNITGLTDNALYTIVSFEENLTKLDDGTYQAILTAVKVGYTSIFSSPVMTNNTGTLFKCWKASYSAPMTDLNVDTAYYLMDKNVSTALYLEEGTYSTVFVVESLGDPIAINKVQVEGPGNFGYGGNTTVTIYGSNNGIDWTYVDAVSSTGTTEISNSNTYKYYRFMPNINLVGGYSQGTTYLYNINFWYPVSCAGGTITQNCIFPSSPVNGDLHLDTSKKPRGSYIWQNDEKVEKQFLKIGKVLKSSGTFLAADIRTLPYNGETVISKSVTIGQHAYDYAHNLDELDVKFSGIFTNYSGGNASLISNDYSPSVSGVPLISSNITEYQYNNEEVFYDKNIFRYVSPTNYLWFAGAEGTNGNFTSATLTIKFERKY